MIVRTRNVLMLTILLFWFALQGESATLNSETLAAWNAYIERANADLQRRLRPGRSFLWTFDDGKRAARVHKGEIVVARVSEKNPIPVPSGRVHHWTGAMFLSGVRLGDVMEVTRDYGRYKEFYSPSVIESKLIGRSPAEDRFSMLLMNRALFLQSALEAEYQVTNVTLDDRRAYSVSNTTRLQEIKNFGAPTEQRLPEGEGSGYIWKLFSIVRLEQRDGGVYVEVEVMALSRDIPTALRLLAEPIVRNVSRNALVISLQQTGQAVSGAIGSAKPESLPVPARSLAGLH